MRFRVIVSAVAVALLALAVIPPRASAAISVTRAELSGGQLRVEGQGAVPNAGISIDGVVRGTADGAGAFKIQVSNFSSPTCKITVSDGSTSTTATLSGCTPSQPLGPPPPGAPAPLMPSDGVSAVQPLTLAWSVVTDPKGISGYHWDVATDSGFAAIVAYGTEWFTITAAPATQTILSGMPNGNYFWRVQAINGASPSVWGAFSAVRTLTVAGTAAGTPGTPAFTFPANLAKFHPYQTFLIAWTPVPGADHYLFEADDEPAFISPLGEATSLPGTQIGRTIGFTATFYYRVRAVGLDGTRGLPSTSIRVDITYAAPIPPPPSLLAPAAGATGLTLPLTFDWTDVPNANFYELQFDDEPLFTGDCGLIVLCIRGIYPSQYTEDSLPAAAKFWRVRSWHGDASPTSAAVSAWSEVRSMALSPGPPSLVSLSVKVFSGGGTSILSTTFAYSGFTPNNMPAGYVQLNVPAPVGGTVVTLASGNPSVAQVPPSVTVPQDEARIGFWITPLQVAADTPVTLSASIGAQTVTAPLTVKPSKVRLLDMGGGFSTGGGLGGTSFFAYIFLYGLAPPGGLVVSLASSSPVATVPATVTVPAGFDGTTFPINTSAVSMPTTVTITAIQGGNTVTGKLILHPPIFVTIGLPTLVGGLSSYAEVTLSPPAPFSTGATLALSSSNPAVASVPANVILGGGWSTGFFVVSTSGVGIATTVTITATWNAQTHSVPMTVLPASLAIAVVSPATVAGGTSTQGTVALDGAAGSVGITVSLSSSNPAVAAVPPSVTIPAAATYASFTITTTSVPTTTSVAISATAGGVSKTVTLTVTASTVPPPTGDKVSLTRCEYTTSKKVLQLEATSTSTSATLRAHVTSTNALIGTLTNNGGGKYSGSFSWPSNPQSVTVKSNLGGFASCTVVAK